MGGYHQVIIHLKCKNCTSSLLGTPPHFVPQRELRTMWSGKPGLWSSGWGWLRKGTPCWCQRQAVGSPGRLRTGMSSLPSVRAWQDGSDGLWQESCKWLPRIITGNAEEHELPREGAPISKCCLAVFPPHRSQLPIRGSQRAFVPGRESDTTLLSFSVWCSLDVVSWTPEILFFWLKWKVFAGCSGIRQKIQGGTKVGI